MSVKVKLDIKPLLSQIFEDASFSAKMHEEIKAGMISAMESGRSPVRNFGRFEKYSGPREKNKSGYPYNAKKKYPQKSVTPVNLKLTGNLHNSIGYAVQHRGKNTITIGVGNNLSPRPSGEAIMYAERHNEGLDGMPQRKFLPTGNGEEFNVSIMTSIRRLLSERILALIKRSNKS